MKVADLSQRLTAAGYDAAETTVRTWEAGRPPRAETIAALEKLFGSRAPVEVAALGDLGAQIAAIDRQTEAINALVDETRLSRQAQEQTAKVLARLIGLAVAGHLPQSEIEAAADALGQSGK